MSAYTPWLDGVRSPEQYDAMHWREARAFLEAFVRRIPERVEALERLVRSSRGFSRWRADGSEESLKRLGAWVLRTLERRELSLEEKKAALWINPELPEAIQRDLERRVLREPRWAFTPWSQAVLLDIGMHMGDLLHRAHRTTRWIRCTSKHSREHNHPLLGYGKNWGFEPIGLPQRTAARMFEGDRTSDGISEIFAIWDEKAKQTEHLRTDRKQWPDRSGVT